MTSEWCGTWHVVARDAAGSVIVGACGHPISGRMRRILDVPLPSDGREVCGSCVAVVVGGGVDPEPVRIAVFRTALAVLAERRSFRASREQRCPSNAA
ncbi:hypothetical protein BJ969_003915 [Saccharopolyspora gloriosae]|uniref:Uncharacterized protein n=1 Tax=Saccharopolyspora gloriosae TaxID=455344 RepID=A0A840NRH7_9PSEU|nr:hypothetical protein [Saccharopolyspora gloriosae]MBB5070827.1 hypothetical protein [Saccharopolyspora gloriosae]